jgi:hypothetical protein
LKQLLMMQLEDQGIIKRVDSHNDFFHNILMAKWNDKLRLYLDLNKELQREEYQLVTIDET